MDLNEFRTRKELIDISLKEMGWDVDDRSLVRVEIDTKQSDFTKNEYRDVDETLRNDLESKYADYVLLDDRGGVMAIIEAKRTSKDPLLTAQTQAELYAKDVHTQTGTYPFIFLANGHEIFFWNYPSQNARQVKAFFTKEDLEKLRWINENKEPIDKFEINNTILDRVKPMECAKRILEHIGRGNRKALMVMATGTGKTRTSMAIIDVLKRAKWVKKVLFIADRRTLRNQAYSKGFKKFFPQEAKEKIMSGKIDTEKNFYAATIQTLQDCYSEISPAYFDLIISDEVHRSIFNKWKDVFTYYDCIQIGLTATPREAFNSDDMRDSFRFFGCQDGKPTALYEYEDAVEDGVLVDFRQHIMSAQTKHQLEGLKKTHLTQSQIEELERRGINTDEIDFEGSAFERKFVTVGTNEVFIQEFMENCQMDQSGTLPAKTIIFGMTKKHARRLFEAFDKLYPDMPGIAKVIVSDDTYAQKSISDFTDKNMPRIAISVDMLDTGVDVPEVCNLVFAKPVHSKIKFWQMIGRGTRSGDICEHTEWLPDGEKKYFKVFDFFKNFEYFNMKPEGEQASASEAISIRLFRTYVQQLAHVMNKGPEDEFARLKQKIKDDVSLIPQDNAGVKDKVHNIQKVFEDDFYDRRGINPVEFLSKTIAPLLRYKQTNYGEGAFKLKCEKLGLAILQGDEKSKERYSQQIAETLECLPETIDDVRAKSTLLQRVRGNTFWDNITYPDTQMLIEEFMPLIQYKTSEPRQPIVVDLDDVVVQRTLIEFGPDGQQEYVTTYREKVEKRIKDLVTEHPAIKKILHNEHLTEKDIDSLEGSLNTAGLHFDESVLNQFYNGSFVQFVKEVLGIYKEEDAEKRIKKAFETHLIEGNKKYNADQFNFIRMLQNVFLKTKKIEYASLWEPPFTNIGALPTDLFPEDELQEWVSLCQNLAAEI